MKYHTYVEERCLYYAENRQIELHIARQCEILTELKFHWHKLNISQTVSSILEMLPCE